MNAPTAPVVEVRDLTVLRELVGRVGRRCDVRHSDPDATFEPLAILVDNEDVQFDWEALWSVRSIAYWTARKVNTTITLRHEPSLLARQLQDRVMWVSGLREELRDPVLRGLLRLDPPLPPL